MRKLLLSLSALLGSGIAMAQWSQVGTQGISTSGVQFPEIAIVKDTAYVAFKDDGQNGKISVKKFNGTTWEYVGQAGFSGSFVDYVQIATDGVVPYVAFQDAAVGNRLSVMKYSTDSAKWVFVGGQGFTPSSAAHLDFLITHNSKMPIVSFNDGIISGKASVMAFTGNNWAYISPSTGITANAVEKTTIAFKDSLLYLSVITTNQVFRGCSNLIPEIYELRPSNSNWTMVYGNIANCVTEIDIAFHPNEVYPYAFYRKEISSQEGHGVVMRYTGTANNWDTVGNAGFVNIARGYATPATPITIDFFNELPVVMYRELTGTGFSRPIVRMLNATTNTWDKLEGLDSLSARNGAGSNMSFYFHGIVNNNNIYIVHQNNSPSGLNGFVYKYECNLAVPAIVVLGNNRIAAFGDYERYQWYNVLGSNKVPISGATQKEYSITSSGIFALEVFSGFCSKMSDDYTFCFIYDTSTTVVDNEIKLTNAAEEASFEWYNCATNQKIDGATGSTFKPTTSGSYRVKIITANGNCQLFGSCIAVNLTTTNIAELTHTANVRIYPNPASQQVKLQNLSMAATATIFSLDGKIVKQQPVDETNNTLSVADITNGVYFIQLSNNQNVILTQRVVVNN